MKPSEKEEEFIRRQELARLKTKSDQANRQESERLRQLHHQHCPDCGQLLKEKTGSPLVLAACPACRGLWFPARELKKLQHEEESSWGRILKKLFT